MATDVVPWRSELPATSEPDKMALLEGILVYNSQVLPSQRAAMVREIVGRRPQGLQATTPAAPSVGAILLRPGVVQAAALGVNYGIVLGLEVSGTLQYSDLPAQALLLGTNYLVLTGLMMSLSLLCLVHSFVRINLRPVYRALLVAMGATGAFGMMESVAFSASTKFVPLLLLLFVVTVPLISLFVALFSIAQGLAQNDARQPAPAVLSSHGIDAQLPPRL